MKLTEIAARINAHLRRFEKDPTINKLDPKYRTRPYWSAGAWRAGSRVAVIYVSYQGSRTLTKAEALRYLEALDSGFVGRHYELEREKVTHTLYKTGDPGAPLSIQDRNGEVVLGLCRVCGRAEAELVEDCSAAIPATVTGESVESR